MGEVRQVGKGEKPNPRFLTEVDKLRFPCGCFEMGAGYFLELSSEK